MKRHEQQAIEELARLLDGGARPDDVAAPVRELASLATVVRDEVELPQPTPAFRAALRTELIEGLGTAPVTLADRVRDVVSERTARWRYSARLLVASATASGLLGTAGVAAAAQQALPGELLYPVKQITEDVRMGIASGYQETGRLHLTFAAERLEELTDGIDGYDADRVIDLLADMDEETLAGTHDLLRAYDESGNELILVVLERFAEQQRHGLSAVFDALPAEAAPFLDRSFEILRRIEVTVAAINQGCTACAGDAATDGGDGVRSVAAPGEGPALGDDTCDCESLLAPVLPGEAAGTTDRLGEALSGDREDADDEGSGEGDTEPGLGVTVPPLPAPLAGIGQALEDAIASFTPVPEGGSDTTTAPLDEPTVPLEDTGGTVEDTTGTVEAPTAGDTGTVDDTTDTVEAPTTDDDGGVVDDTTGTIDELLSDTEDTTLP